MPLLSVIIPALNEQRALPATLEALMPLPLAVEVLVVDGGSDDATVSVAKGCSGVTVVHSTAGRAAQLNHGAAAAQGDVLLFLHADTLLPQGALAALLRLHERGELEFGGFRQQFSGSSAGLRLVSRIHNFRCRTTGVFYGDQAMFVRSDLFKSVGGFPAVAELEDIRLSEALLRAGAKPQLLPDAVITDSRKFEQMGVLRAFLYCLLILCCHELRLPLRGRRFFAAYR